MAQVTPFQGSRLAETVLMGERIKQGQKRNQLSELASQRQGRALDLRERQFEASQRPEPLNPQEMILGTLEKVSGLNIDNERKAQLFKRTVTQNLIRGIENRQISREQAESVAQSLLNIEADAFEGDPVDKFNSEFRSMREKIRLLEDPNTSETEKEAIRVDLGLDPRAVGSSNITITRGDAGVTAEDVADTEATLAGGREAGTQAVQASGEAIEQLSSVRQNIATIDEAIEAIDEGASSGAISSRLPSIRAASVKLDNVQRRLGLDVIGSVTFGALSKGELDLALATALPTNLDEPELREWLVRKKSAQQKLAAELEEAAIFLGKPGNTRAEFMEMKTQGGDKPLSEMTDEELERLANGG